MRIIFTEKYGRTESEGAQIPYTPLACSNAVGGGRKKSDVARQTGAKEQLANN